VTALRALLLSLAGVLAFAAPAIALREAPAIETAASALRSDPVYVDPRAERRLTGAEADALRRNISRSGAGPVYIAVLPRAVVESAGGNATEALRQLAMAVRRPGTYAAVIGDSFRAGATRGALPRGRAGELAGEALRAHRGQGTAAVLSDFVDRVAAERSGGAAREPAGGGSEGGGAGGLLILLLLVPLGLFLVTRAVRRRGEQRRALEEVKSVAREDLVALGDDIRSLEIDVDMPDADPKAREDYGRAVELYGQADQAWSQARRVQDLERVTSLLEEGRYAMTSAKARLEGRPPPERRPPCFFDPRHGPSQTDVEWAPSGGSPRPVPACAADARRVMEGMDPDARLVPVGGRMTPYWNAGPAYMPWAGGFFGGFGGGFLPGLLVGSMLGGGLGFGGWADDAHGAGWDGGDGGDFGGGDFGGGDFGGGGDF
jgi:hypothetical protein